MKKNLQYILFTLLCSVTAKVGAQWNPDITINTSVCSAVEDQEEPKMVTDARQGAIIVWTDFRNDPTKTQGDIYVQRIDKDGFNMWTPNGVAVCTNISDQSSPVIVEDGSGGAIIAWTDLRNGNKDIYQQRIDSSGNVMWANDGVTVVAKPNSQQDPHIVALSTGASIIVWQDSSNNFWDVYAQYMDENGLQQWNSSGVVICNAVLNQINARITRTTSGKAIITWQDFRNTNDYDIYAQEIDVTGTVSWATNGIAVCTAANTQNNPKIKADMNGGAYVAWQDKRNGNDYNIYMQRIIPGGTVALAANGVSVCSSPDNQSAIDMVVDATSSLVIAWKDNRNQNFDVYAQRVSDTGGSLWATNGIAIATGASAQLNPNIIIGGNGYVIVWEDSSLGSWDIRAQSIDASGNLYWGINGAWVTTAADDQISAKNVTDFVGGCIFAWQDKRNTGDDIYAQKLNISGTAGVNEVNNIINGNFNPNPFNDKTVLHFAVMNSAATKFIMSDVQGKIVPVDVQITSSSITINRGKLEAGIYIYEVISEGNIKSGKLIITE